MEWFVPSHDRHCRPKLIPVRQYRKALKQLAIGRPRLLRLYTPGVPPRSAVPIPYPAVVAEPHTPPSRNARSAVSQASTSRPSRPTLAGTSKATSKTRPTAPPFPVEWLDLAWLPSPIDGTELDEVVRSVILQALILSWTALLGLENEEAYVSQLTSIREADRIVCTGATRLLVRKVRR